MNKCHVVCVSFIVAVFLPLFFRVQWTEVDTHTEGEREKKEFFPLQRAKKRIKCRKSGLMHAHRVNYELHLDTNQSLDDQETEEVFSLSSFLLGTNPD